MSREEQTETGKLNLDAHVPPSELFVQPPESPEDAEHRRWKDRVEITQKIQTDHWILVFAILFVSAFSIAALVAFSWGDSDQRAWGASALTLVLGGLVGYLTGKNAP